MGIYKIIPTIQRYAWGHTKLLPDFLRKPADGEPWAELWLGTHPRGPSLVAIGSVEKPEHIGLSAFLQTHGYHENLTYLFKVLAIESPLSLQVHPAKGWAEKRYQEEELSQVPKDAPNRLYKDTNHKPEIIMALTDLTVMCGFRTEPDIRHTLSVLFHTEPFSHDFAKNLAKEEGNFFRATFQTLMSADKVQKKRLVQWALQAHKGTEEGALMHRLYGQYPEDIGVLAPLFLQVIHLKPGEALFQAAQEIHAYVSGMGIELMANSDNVIRAGLTPKHVDIPELLRVVDFQHHAKSKIKGVKKGGRTYFPIEGVSDFLLATIDVSSSQQPLRIRSNNEVELWICVGSLTVTQGNRVHTCKQGDTLLVLPSAEPIELAGNGIIYTATSPSSR